MWMVGPDRPLCCWTSEPDRLGYPTCTAATVLPSSPSRACRRYDTKKTAQHVISSDWCTFRFSYSYFRTSYCETFSYMIMHQRTLFCRTLGHLRLEFAKRSNHKRAAVVQTEISDSSCIEYLRTTCNATTHWWRGTRPAASCSSHCSIYPTNDAVYCNNDAVIIARFVMRDKNQG